MTVLQDRPKTDHYRYPEHFFSPWDDFTANIPNWKKFLGPLAGKPGLRFLEIGAAQGRAAVWLAENILSGDDSMLYTVDPATHHSNGDVRSDHQQANLAPYLESGKITFAQTYSSIFLKLFPATSWSESRNRIDMPSDLPPVFDFVYIDGDHSSRQVLADAVLSFELTKPRGLICFDDYPWVDRHDPSISCKAGIDAFLSAYAGHYDLLHQDWQVIVRKK